MCDLFFNPTIAVVIIRLRSWCMLGVFLLPAFTRLGHECQDLLSACVHKLDLGLYSHPKEFGGEWSKKPCFLQGGKPLRGGLNPQRCITQDREPNILLTELFHPLTEHCYLPFLLRFLATILGVTIMLRFCVRDHSALVSIPIPSLAIV